MPLNLLLIQSLRKMYCYYGDELRIECPTCSGDQMTLWEIANEIANRLGNIFLRDYVDAYIGGNPESEGVLEKGFDAVALKSYLR